MSNDKYFSPKFKNQGFTCPFCGVYAFFVWERLLRQPPYANTNTWHAHCSHCNSTTVWLSENNLMIWPQDISTAPLPNPDMPEEILSDYTEARSIVSLSPRGAAALLRLSIQKLCKHLNEKGENINDDIGSLVEKGLPVRIQQALDIVRVTGNNAVHPGEMQLQEDRETVSSLFELVNMIVENQISQPKAVDNLYGKLPPNAVEAIKKRDG